MPRIGLGPVEKSVINLATEHKRTWRDEPEEYWFFRLIQEVGELGSALANDHEHPPDWELRQIAAICINWLQMRRKDADA